MTCRELIEFLAEYVTDDLPQDERAAFEQHLSACRDCRAYLDSYTRTISLEKTALDDPQAAAARMPAELVDAILAARRARDNTASDSIR